MSLKRPFAYNTGSTINGTEQYGDLSVGVDDQAYSKNIGGVTWWMGPDEEIGYIIAKPVHNQNQPNPVGVSAGVSFSRSSNLTEESFLNLVNNLSFTGQTFTQGSTAKSWLEDNGYWTSYTVDTGGDTPQPPQTSPRDSATPTPTPTETSCFEYLTDENGNYITDENGNYIVLRELCVSATPTNTPTNTPTPTTTPTV